MASISMRAAAFNRHLALTNLLYHTLPVFHPLDFDALLERFIEMARGPTRDHVEKFFATCHRIRQSTDNPSTTSVFRMIESLRDEVVGLYSQDYPLDPCLTSFVALMSSWELGGGRRSDIVAVNYDETPVMKAQQEMLAKLCDQSRKPIAIGVGEEAYRLPLPVDPLNFVPSENHPAVQVADLVASSVGYWVRSTSADSVATDFQASLRELTHAFVTHSVWPDVDAIGRRDDSHAGVNPATEAARWLFHKP